MNVSVSSALGIGISPDKSCAGSSRARLASRLSGLQLQSLQLVVSAQLSVPRKLSLHDPSVPLLSRRNPYFAALLVQLDHDTWGLPYSLPQF